MNELDEKFWLYVARTLIKSKLIQGEFEFGKVLREKTIPKKDIALEITKLAREFEKPKIKWLEICEITKNKFIIIQGVGK